MCEKWLFWPLGVGLEGMLEDECPWIQSLGSVAQLLCWQR